MEDAVAAVRVFTRSHIDPAAIDREADIPRSVIDGLAELGVLGMTAPVENGGRGFSQLGYCRIMEVIGGHCSSTAVFVNAHHSIGIRALVLFGTPEQKASWLPSLTRGEKLAAFALTEEQAGSDASNVQTTATPSADGQTYVLNGTKRVHHQRRDRRRPDRHGPHARSRGGESKITAFLVTPDMPGFEVVEARMPKCGIRGTATAKLAFHDMAGAGENVLGPVGKGLKVALTVLDFGRTTFGASCTGMAKFCLAAATRHAAERQQFGRPLADLELVKKKLAFLAATAYAMEATTYETAALIDRGAEDYMLETAILKVFSTEALWQGVYETLQVYGGQGYFTDEPYERMMRDARINTIGEGANEVLLAFIAVVGMRDVGLGLKSTLEGLKRPSRSSHALVVQPRAHGPDGAGARCAGDHAMLRPVRHVAGAQGRAVRLGGRARPDGPPRSRAAPAARSGTNRRAAIALSRRPARWPGSMPSSPPRATGPAIARPPSFICAWLSAAAMSRSAPQEER